MDKRGIRAKWFPCLVYEEQIHDFRCALLSSPFEFALICHDRDVDENGELKKRHYHAVVISDKREFHTTLAKKLCIDERFVQMPYTNEPNGAMRYLLHLDNPEKMQYKTEEIETNINTEKFDKYLVKVEKISPDEKNDRILDDIELLAHGQIGYREFLSKNPAFIYQARNLSSLLALVQSGRW